MTRINVMIMDDHPLCLTALKNMVQVDCLFHVIDTCSNSQELLFSLSRRSTDIVIIDCTPAENDIDPFSLINEINADYPEVKIVTLGEHRKHHYHSRVAEVSILTHLCKSWSVDKMALMLNVAANNKPANDDNITKASALTYCERETLQFVRAGLTVTQISMHLNKSVKTVSAQKRSAMRKLGIMRECDIFRNDIDVI